MINLKQYEVWFVTGSQHLYGPKTLETVAEHSKEIAQALSAALPVAVIFKPVLPGPEEIRAWTIPLGATAPQAAGVIHTDFEKGFIRAEIYRILGLKDKIV